MESTENKIFSSVLVTGGAGFLGSHLIDKLIALGLEVYCVDNLYTGTLDNIRHLQGNPKFHFINHNVQNEIDLKVDGIFNLACPASPVHYQRNPVETIKTNFLGSLNMLELSKRYNCRILQASTSEIYGDPKVNPQVEDYWGNVNPIGIRSCYDEGKRAAETLFMDYRRNFGLDTRIVRIFNTYGPRMAVDDGRVVSNFIMQAITNQNITIYGDGQQIRSLCYVDDLIEGIWKLFISENIYEPLNIGNPQPTTILDLAKEIIQLTNSNSKIEFRSLPKDDPLQRQPAIGRANKILNWFPQIDRKNGLEKTIEYFNNLVRLS